MADPDLARYYERYDEHSRLANAYGQLEFVRTLELLSRYLPPPPARVLDIGGATGHYSEALGQRGYEMHLLDAMEKHVRAASTRAHIASAVAGDARKLHWPDRFADAVLLMGPLYHLTAAADRRLADGLIRGFVHDPRFRPILLRDIESGEHRNTSEEIEFFTNTHFHLPGELAREVLEAGFVDARVFAVEGLAFVAPDLEKSWLDLEKREFLLELLRKTEEQPPILGASPHLLVRARAGQIRN